MTCSKVKRTGSDQFCGLSAEISKEIAYRTPVATPSKTPGKSQSKRIMAPLSRDLFRAKMAIPGIQLTQTASMSIDDSDSGSSAPEKAQPKPPKTQPMRIDFSTASAKKNRRRRNSLGSHNGGPAKATPKATPKAQGKTKMRKTPFPGLSARKRLKKCLTPPRSALGSHARGSHGPRTSLAAAVTLSTAYDGVDDFRLTSAEADPSPFQVEPPSKKEVRVHSRICRMMDGYTAVHRDFNFAMLSGISHATLEREVERSTEERPMIAGSCHRDVVKTLLDCAGDIVVEGFFREYTEPEESENEGERMEAVILSSDSLRQIIVCFRGSTANQAKPLGKGGYFGKEGHGERFPYAWEPFCNESHY